MDLAGVSFEACRHILTATTGFTTELWGLPCRSFQVSACPGCAPVCRSLVGLSMALRLRVRAHGTGGKHGRTSQCCLHRTSVCMFVCVWQPRRPEGVGTGMDRASRGAATCRALGHIRFGLAAITLMKAPTKRRECSIYKNS